MRKAGKKRPTGRKSLPPHQKANNTNLSYSWEACDIPMERMVKVGGGCLRGTVTNAIYRFAPLYSDRYCWQRKMYYWYEGKERHITCDSVVAHRVNHRGKV